MTAGSPIAKDVLDTMKKEGKGTFSLLKGWSVHVLVSISIYAEENRNKQLNCLVGKLEELGTVGSVINYLILLT